MKNGKYENVGGKAGKGIVLLIAVALLVGGLIGGTVAWLLDATPVVENTFTVGKVTLTLKETPYDAAKNSYGTPAEGVQNTYPLVPANTYTKDPVVAVDTGSEDCWLFFKLEKVNDPDTYLTYELDLTGWTSLPGNEGVYYRKVAKTATTRSWKLIKSDTVTVKDNIVNAGTAKTGEVDMPAADKQPELNFSAYAVQKDNLTVTDAWAKVSP